MARFGPLFSVTPMAVPVETLDTTSSEIELDDLTLRIQGSNSPL